MDSNALNLSARATAETIEDLVAEVRRGVVRIPDFQRGLRWEANDVVSLFDSVYKGYPIGSLLLREAKAGADQLRIGPLTIDAPEVHSALWVIDGQQRLTALAAGLARPTPIPVTPDDPFVVYFDAASLAFKTPTRGSSIPASWVPVAQLLDSSALNEWVFHWALGADPALRRAVFQAGSRIREYKVPLYIVATDDQQLLRDVFYRINHYGKSLKWDEVHDALFARASDKPSSIADLANALGDLRMGRPDEAQLLPCLVAFRGLDVTRTISEHYQRDPEVLRSTVQDALPAVRRVLSFLKRSAQIAHLRLLPRSTPLPILTRFFAVFPEPNARTSQLLCRWTWRTLLAANSYDERTLLRHGVSAVIADDEEGTVQRLLELVPKRLTQVFSLPARFDARGADSRLALLGLASLRPLDLTTFQPIQVAELIEDQDVDAFRKIVDDSGALGRSPANRILLPGKGAAKPTILSMVEARGEARALLQSHAISDRGVQFLSDNRLDMFFMERRGIIEQVVQRHTKKLAAWSQSDRPSIPYLLDGVDR